MPIYDFKCSDCGAKKEAIVSSSTTLVECKACGGKMEKTLSGSQSFYFKGQGTYAEKSMSKSKK